MLKLNFQPHLRQLRHGSLSNLWTCHVEEKSPGLPQNLLIFSTLSTARHFKAAPIPLDKPAFTGTTAAAKGPQTVQSCIMPAQVHFSRWKRCWSIWKLPKPPPVLTCHPKKIKWHDIRSEGIEGLKKRHHDVFGSPGFRERFQTEGFSGFRKTGHY